jgi:hypothetical protein
MALNPVTLIVAGIVALIAVLVLAYKKFEGFKKVVDGVFSGIKWWISNVTIPLFESMLSVVKGIFNGFAKLWNNTIGKISVKIPYIPGLPGRGKEFGVPNIPMLADGGIVTSPTLAIIGEAGAEAVIPLDRLGGMGGGGDIYVTVQGGDPNAVVDALRRYQRKNGAIPIRVTS